MFRSLLIVKLFFISTLVFSSDFYKFNFESINGKELRLQNYKNKLVLVVNTASMCGYTKQYDGLQKLYDSYKDKGLVVIGVPSNSFMQEFNSEDRVKDFCETKFNISFPMTKITDVTGDEKHPLYNWLKEEYNIKPRWNFHKVLISRKGKLIDSYSAITKPMGEKLLAKIEENLEG